MRLLRCAGACRWAAATAVLSWLFLGAPTAAAHKPSDAYLQLVQSGATVTERFDIALRDLDRDLVLDADDDGALRWGEVRARWPEIEALAAASVRIASGGRPCTPIGSPGPPQLESHSDGRYAVLTRTLQCADADAAAPLSVDYRLFAASDPTHRGIVSLRGGAGAAGSGATAATAVLTPGAAPHVFGPVAGARGDGAGSSAPSSLGGFVAEGVHHILIGVDHVLFLLALLLPAVLVFDGGRAGGRHLPGRARWSAAPALRPVLWDVLRVVTAFTVAHSITLALAVLDVLDPPSRWVESIIAASVALAALNNVRPLVPPRSRWGLTFGFGLVHGFGFAGALKDLGLQQGDLAVPLVGFNLGVELGQLAIVALFVPLAWWLRGTRFYRGPVRVGGSLAIAALALVWLVERAGDVRILGIGA